METILITGATGNVGQSILKYFKPPNEQRLIIASRPQQRKEAEAYFDFEDLPASEATLAATDVLFLLRPPQLADVKKYFYPLIEACKRCGVKHIVFLSVQGAETTSIIPHAKIEKSIQKSGIQYTFIRPSYFMQNLTNQFLDDIKQRDRIFIPAGNAPFLWIDVDDIGKAIAAVLQNLKPHQNKAYTITGNQLLSFGEVAHMLSKTLNKKIEYVSPNLVRFYFQKRKEGLQRGFIIVMILLHFLPRFQKTLQVSSDFKLLTGKEPVTMQDFIDRHTQEWVPYNKNQLPLKSV